MSNRTRELKAEQLRDIAHELRRLRREVDNIGKELAEHGEKNLQLLTSDVNYIDKAIVASTDFAKQLEDDAAVAA